MRDLVLRHIARNPGIARKALLARMSNGVTASMLGDALDRLASDGAIVIARGTPTRGRTPTTYTLAHGVEVDTAPERVRPDVPPADRRRVLAVIAGLGSETVARLDGFMPGARATLAKLEAEGLVEIKTQRMFRAKATLVARYTGKEVPTVGIRPDLQAEHDAALKRATGWVMKLRTEAATRHGTPAQQRHAKLALEMLKVILRAPFRYVAETPLAALAKLADDPDEPHEPSQYMRAARRLEALGMLEVVERKGKGRVTTVRLRDPIPYPMEG